MVKGCANSCSSTYMYTVNTLAHRQFSYIHSAQTKIAKIITIWAWGRVFSPAPRVASARAGAPLLCAAAPSAAALARTCMATAVASSPSYYLNLAPAP